MMLNLQSQMLLSWQVWMLPPESTITGATAANPDNNETITITLGVALSGTDFEVTDNTFGFGGSEIQDTNSNVLVGAVSAQNVSDGAAPILNSATAISNTQVVLAFSEDMTAPTYTDGVAISGVTIVGVNQPGDLDEFTINVTDLGGSTDYTGNVDITLDGNDVMDDANGNSAGDQSAFSIDDGQAAVFASSSATGVENTGVDLTYDVGEGGTIYFSLNTSDESGSITTAQIQAGTGTNNISGEHSNFTIGATGGTTENITFTGPIASGTVYIHFYADDGNGNESAIQVESFTSNQSPVISFNSPLTVVDGNSITFTGGDLISIADADTDAQSVTVTVTNGIFTASGGSAGGATVGGSPGSPVTISGSLADVNAELAGGTFDNISTGGASVQVATDDGNTGTDTETVVITVFANASDIVKDADASFTIPASLEYIDHVDGDVDQDGVGGDDVGIKIGEMTLRDGGGTADGDASSTTLTDLTLEFTNPSLIQRVALYPGTIPGAEIDEVSLTDAGDADGTNDAVFTGLSLVAAQGASTDFSVVITFNNAAVNDGTDQIDFTVTAATASTSGSRFVDAAAAGNNLNPAGGENLVNVTATLLEITSEPVGLAINTDFQIDVEAEDANGNIDVDWNDNIVVSMTTEPGGATLSGTTSIDPSAGAPFGTTSHTDLEVDVAGDYVFEVNSSGLTADNTATITASSAQSDIIEYTIAEDGGVNTTFDYPQNIDYTAYNAADIDDTGDDELLIAQFLIRDGGAAGDASDKDTRITGLTLELTTGAENIDRIAIYTVTDPHGGDFGAGDEVDELNSTDDDPSGGIVGVFEDGDQLVFDFTVAGNFDIRDADDGGGAGDGFDNDEELIAVYVTFKSDVTDNEQIQLTVVDATANIGAGRSDFIPVLNAPLTLAGDENTIEVTADRLAFNAAANPNGNTYEREDGRITSDDITFTVEAQDANGNVDLDETSNVRISDTTPGTDVTGLSIGATALSLTAGTASTTVTIDTEHDDLNFVISDEDGTTGSGSSTTDIELNNGNASATFDVFDTTAPTVINLGTDLTPADDANPVSITNTLQIIFSEDVAGVFNNDLLILSLTPSHVITFDATDPEVSITGNVVDITLSENLRGGHSYSVTIPDGAFDDSPNNTALGGDPETYVSQFNSLTDWNFTMEPDATAPSVTITREAVANGDMDSGTSDDDVTFRLEFDEEIEPSSFEADGQDIRVTFTGMTDVDGNATSGQTGDNYGVVVTNSGDNRIFFAAIDNINAAVEGATLAITLIGDGAAGSIEDLVTPTPNYMGSDTGPSTAFVFDQQAPVLTVNTDITNDTRPEITGTVDDNTATVTVSVDGKNYPTTLTGTGPYTWTVADDAILAGDALGEGVFNVIASGTDPAGNTDIDGTALELTIDLTAPTIVETYVFDTNGDGDIDEFTFRFDEAVDDGSITVTDFQIDGSNANVTRVADDAVANSVDPGAGDPDDEYLTFWLDDDNRMIGTASSVVSYIAGTLTDVAGNAVGGAAVSATDMAPPGEPTATFFDTDGDGNIDEVVIAFDSEDLDELSAAVGHFNVGGANPDAVLLGGSVMNSLDTSADDEYVTLSVDTDNVVGTAPVTITYTPGSLADEAGNPATGGTLSSTDQALPVMINAYQYDVNPVDGVIDEVVLEMSEDIDDDSIDPARFTIDGNVPTVATGGDINNPDNAGTYMDGTDDQYITFDVAGVTAGTDVVTVAYTLGATNIEDLAALDALANADINGVDKAQPIVTNVTSTPSTGSYRQGDVIAIEVEFSETVSQTGTPTIELEMDGTNRNASYSSGNGTNTLTFNYNVQSDDETADLGYPDGTSIVLGGGSIDDGQTPANDAIFDIDRRGIERQQQCNH